PGLELEGALAGVDTVIHLAARVHRLNDTAADPAAEYRRVNVEGTRALLEASVRAGVRKFVLASTVKVMGEATTTPWVETMTPAPADPYGASKLEAERLVRRIAGDAGMHAPI